MSDFSLFMLNNGNRLSAQSTMATAVFRFMRMYADAELPAARAGKWAARYEQRNSSRDDIWRGRLSPAEIRRSRQGYYGSISFVDEQIGRILETLEKRGWLEE